MKVSPSRSRLQVILKATQWFEYRVYTRRKNSLMKFSNNLDITLRLNISHASYLQIYEEFRKVSLSDIIYLPNSLKGFIHGIYY